MASRIGLIQTRGIGDIIIALPIADFYLEKGCEVYWPIDARLIPFFREAKPQVNFLPVGPDDGYFIDTPLRLLREAGCERIFMLYSHIEGRKMAREELAFSLKFDEYKYAIADVPFFWKWKLRIDRNAAREKALHERLGITRPYICIHSSASDYHVNLVPPPQWQKEFQIISITELTDNPFDWLYTLEHASKLVLLDSCFSNLVEQLNFSMEKYFILRSPVRATPVLINGWRYFGGKRTQPQTPPTTG